MLFGGIYRRKSKIISGSKCYSFRKLLANWTALVEYEQGGNLKAEYGDKILERISKRPFFKIRKGF